MARFGGRIWNNSVGRYGRRFPFPAHITPATPPRAYLDGDVYPYYTVLNPIDLDIYPEFVVAGQLDLSIFPTYSTQHLVCDVFPKYRTVQYIKGDLYPRFTVYPAIGSSAAIVADPQLAALAGGSPHHIATYFAQDPDFEISFNVVWDTGSIDIGCRAFHFQVDMAESSPTTWSLNFVDPFGQVNPMNINTNNNLGGTFLNVMDERPFSGSGGNELLTKFLNVRSVVGGIDWNFQGVGTSFSHARNWEKNFIDFVWKGTDNSIRLNVDAQTMSTVRSGARTGTTKAATVLGEILSKYKVEYDLKYFMPDDFVIPVMHRQNSTPQDWVSQILGALMFEWRFEHGKKFVPYLNNAKNSSPQLIHDFAKMLVYDESYEGSLVKVINKVIAIRAAEGGGVTAGLNDPIDMFAFGNGYSQDFSPALDAISYHVVQANNGFVSNFLFYRGSELIAVRDVTTGSANYGLDFQASGLIIGCTRVTWTWGVAPGGFIGLGSPGRIQFTGVPHIEADVWGGDQFGQDGTQDDPAPSFRAEAKDDTSIGKYGPRPIEISASPLIPDKATLQKFADRYLERVLRQPRKVSHRVPLNPFIVPGSVIKEIDPWLGTTKFVVVTNCSHSFSDQPGERYTNYTATDYSQLIR